MIHVERVQWDGGGLWVEIGFSEGRSYRFSVQELVALRDELLEEKRLNTLQDWTCGVCGSLIDLDVGFAGNVGGVKVQCLSHVRKLGF